MDKAAVVILLALVLASSADGMVFSWTDSSGVKHFTNKRDEIPERYRTKAKPLYPEHADMLPGQHNAQPQTVKPAVPLPVQQPIPVEQPKIQQPAAVSDMPHTETAPVTGRKARRRPPPREEE